MGKRRAFTLVEIMIVVAIVALLAALAIPNLLRMRLQANEVSATASLRTISTAMETYRVSNANYIGATLGGLSGSAPPYIDPVLGAGTKQGYTFTLNLVNSNQYWAEGTPVTPNVTGVRYFYVDEQAVVCAGAAVAGGHAVGATCPNGFNPVE